jgi:cobalt-zinc-cadmium efflux system membrane fusion protein
MVDARDVEQQAGCRCAPGKHTTMTLIPSGAVKAIPEMIKGGTAVGRAPGAAAVSAVLLLSGLLAGCWPDASAVTISPPPAKDPNIIQVSADQMHQLSIVTVEPYPFRVQKQAIGQIAFNEDASTVVTTPFSGRVIRVLAKIGEQVKKGDPLFEIDSPEVVQAQTDLIAALHGRDKAQSALIIAQRQLERNNRLIVNKAISQRDADVSANDAASAESDFKTAEGTLTAARNRLRVIIGRTQEEVDRVERDRVINPLITINAPIDGTVIARKVGPGQYVRSDVSDALYSIADLSTMWLKANVPEADIPLVRVGQEIEVRVTAIPDRVFSARIKAVGAASDASTRRVAVRSEIPNPDGALKSEMFASFKIATSDAEPAPHVPVNAVIWEGEQAVVWIEREPMLFERRKVTIGTEQDGRMRVTGGLEQGEHVVARGAIFVQNVWQQ